MECNNVKNLLYEFVTESLQGDDLIRVKNHLEGCENCSREVEKITHTVKLLDEVKPPPLSADFKATVLSRTQELPLPGKPVWQRIKEHVMPYITPSLTPAFMKGAAVAVVLLVTVTIFIPGILSEKEKHWKDIEIKLHGVKNPVIIEIDNSEQALDQLKELIHAHDGTVLQTIWVEQGIQILFHVKQEKESSLIEEFTGLGSIHMENEGYKVIRATIGGS